MVVMLPHVIAFEGEVESDKMVVVVMGRDGKEGGR